MEKVKNNLAALIKVKTIITLLLTIVFCALALTGVISGEDFLSMFSMVIIFYFGTQAGKKEEAAANTDPAPIATGTAVYPAETLASGTVDSATANEVHPRDPDEMNPIGFER